jgi:hypothetical protein
MVANKARRSVSARTTTTRGWAIAKASAGEVITTVALLGTASPGRTLMVGMPPSFSIAASSMYRTGSSVARATQRGITEDLTVIYGI